MIHIQWYWLLALLSLFAIGGAIGWQFIRHNNKPIADKSDQVTDKVTKL